MPFFIPIFLSSLRELSIRLARYDLVFSFMGVNGLLVAFLGLAVEPVLYMEHEVSGQHVYVSLGTCLSIDIVGYIAEVVEHSESIDHEGQGSFHYGIA